jgi:hypothetical protein
VDWLFDLVKAATDLVPGARLLQRGYGSIERLFLRELRARLDRLDPIEASSETEGASLKPVSQTPAAVLAELLDRSIEQSPEQAKRDTFLVILHQLVPDEARILAALSDGGSHPAIHVTAGSTLGSSTRRVLSNLSSVGQAAGVQLREMTPHYISHLLELGLVELAPEDPDLALKYEILESHTQIRDAIARIGREQKGKARIVRRTVRLTALGRDLWATCQHAELSSTTQNRTR